MVTVWPAATVALIGADGSGLLPTEQVISDEVTSEMKPESGLVARTTRTG